jgi:hypothetical protein
MNSECEEQQAHCKKLEERLERAQEDLIDSYLKENQLLFTFTASSSTDAAPPDLATVVRLVRSWSERSPRQRQQANYRPPFNAEYLLYLFLRRAERDIVIGDLLECYGQLAQRFDKRHADIWFYKQVIGSLYPLVRRAVLRLGALVWLGRVLRRLIS